MKRRQEVAEEAERQRVQAEQEARAAAEAEAEAARLAASRDSHDAPGSPVRQEAGNEDSKRIVITIIINKLYTKTQ